MEHPADRLAERVLGGAVGDVHRQSGHEAAAGHLRAGGRVGAVAVGRDERAADEPDRLQRDRVADRRADGGDHARDGLGERVDARLRGRVGRDGVREHRVDDGVLRAQRRRRDAALAAGGGIGDDRAAGDLRARPRRRRDGDERDDRMRVRRLQVLEAHVFLRADARGLRGVDHRAAAERDDRVRPRPRHGRCRGVDDVAGRLARRLVEAVDLEVRAPQREDGVGDGVVALLETLVDDEQHAAGAVRRGDAAELERGALAETDPDGQVVGEGSDRHRDTFGLRCIP